MTVYRVCLVCETNRSLPEETLCSECKRAVPDPDAFVKVAVRGEGGESGE